MIIDFEFLNHRSFKDTQSFSMRRDTSLQNSKPSVYARDIDEGLSMVSAVYGANASGKTNFFDAINTLKGKVTDAPTDNNENMMTSEPFIGMSDKPSCFRILFVASNKKKYIYELEITGSKVTYERLSMYTSTHTSLVFERDIDSHEMNCGAMVPDKEKDAVPFFSEKNPDSTILFFLRDSDNDDIKQAYLFIKRSLILRSIDSPSMHLSILPEKIEKDKKLADILRALLPAADLGIQNIKLVKENESTISLEERDIMLEAIRKIMKHRNPNISNDELDKKLNEDHDKLNAVFLHRIDGKLVEMKEGDESFGTLIATAFFSDLLPILLNGSVYIVDEIDRSLHPSLVAQIIEIFNNNETNPNGAQLIFSTHDISLLDSSIYGEDLLDRDQVWFVEKDFDGMSDLYPLTRIKINGNASTRKDDNIYKKYIAGRYGALPKVSLATEMLTFWERSSDE